MTFDDKHTVLRVLYVHVQWMHTDTHAQKWYGVELLYYHILSYIIIYYLYYK